MTTRPTAWSCDCGASPDDDKTTCPSCGRGRPAVCRTPEDAFRAGWDEPCEHSIADITECESCRLTDDEISRLVVLLGGLRESAPAAGSLAA